MNVKLAMEASRPGVAERTDAKGRRWTCFEQDGVKGGILYYGDGRMLKMSFESCRTLEDWTPKDPKGAVKRIWP